MRWLLIVCTTFMLMACSSTIRYEPEDEASTLVVGQIMLDAESYLDFGDLTLNGKHTHGLKLVFRNMKTKRTINLVAGSPQGLFYFPAEPGVEYQLIEISYKHESGGSWYRLRTRPRNFSFTVSREGVHNLGPLVWRSDKSRQQFTLSQTYKYGELKEQFAERYPESGWNAFSWFSIYR